MVYGESTHSKSFNYNGVGLVVSVPTVIGKDTKQQLKWVKDVRVRALASKVNKQSQQRGVTQEIDEGNYVAVASPTKSILYCGFCNNNHKYPAYGKRYELCVHTTEYMLASLKKQLSPLH